MTGHDRDLMPGSESDIEFDSDGEWVRDLQEFLISRGHELSETGIFDQATRDALKSFDESTGSSSDLFIDMLRGAQDNGLDSSAVSGFVETFHYALLDQGNDEYGNGDSDEYGDGDSDEEEGKYLNIPTIGDGNSGEEEGEYPNFLTIAPVSPSHSATATTTEGRYPNQTKLGPLFEGENMPGSLWWRGRPRQTFYPDTEDQATELYGVDVRDGRVTKYGPGGEQVPLDTTEERSERMIFTMDADGGVRATSEQVKSHDEIKEYQVIHHSSLARGQNVSAAGEMKVREGTVEEVSDKSGHYQPDLVMTAQVNERLAEGGVDTEKVTYRLGDYFRKGRRKTVLSGMELGAYNREEFLKDLCQRDTEHAIKATFKGGLWDRMDEALREREFRERYAAIYKKYTEYSDRELYAKAREVIEERHNQLRAVLGEVRKSTPADWLPDPVDKTRFRWWDGDSWTKYISDESSESVVDPEWVG